MKAEIPSNFPYTATAFLIGAGTSIVSGYIGMRIAVYTNNRTTYNCCMGEAIDAEIPDVTLDETYLDAMVKFYNIKSKDAKDAEQAGGSGTTRKGKTKDLKQGFMTAFQGGQVLGFCLVGLALLTPGSALAQATIALPPVAATRTDGTLELASVHFNAITLGGNHDSGDPVTLTATNGAVTLASTAGLTLTTGTGTSVRVVLCAELRYFMMINLVLAVGVAGALPSAESEPFGVAQLKSQASHTSRARLHHTRNDPCSTPLYLAVTRALVAPSQHRLLLLEPILRAEGAFHPPSHHVLDRRHRQRRAGDHRLRRPPLPPRERSLDRARRRRRAGVGG